MKYYLVDFENIKVDSLKLLAGIGEGDSVTFFCTTKTTKNMPTSFLLDSSKKNIKLSFFEIKTGTKNAMDFQLATYLGFIIGKCEEGDQFFVVSKDKGYSAICDFWKERKVEVNQIGVEDEKKTVKVKKKTKAAETAPDGLEEKIKGVVGTVTPDRLKKLTDAVRESKTKTELNEKLTKICRSTQKGGEMYQKLKHLVG